MYLKKVDPYEIMRQCRHASILQTYDYLTNLGLFINTEELENLDSFGS